MRALRASGESHLDVRTPSRGSSQMAVATAPAAGVTRWARVARSLSPAEWRRAALLTVAIVALHVIGFGLLLGFVAPQHLQLGTGAFGIGIGITAYTLGMRHAFDADHIGAIDNTTRKLMSDGQRPVSVGFFFSLGHSAVVFALTFAVAATTATFASLMEPVRAFASVVGTGLSLLFLVAIASANVMTLVSLVRALLRERAGGERGAGEHGGHVHEMAAGGLMFLNCLAYRHS